jgi:DNA-binding transcriptional LysR family regulator
MRRELQRNAASGRAANMCRISETERLTVATTEVSSNSHDFRGRRPVQLASRLDFVTLKLFVAIVEEQSFQKAAERELIAPSAVSKRIADLESATRVELLLRQQKLPTAAGEVLLRYARSMLRDLARLEEEIAEHASGTRGVVRIAASESALLEFVPSALASFNMAYPNIRIDLRSELSSSIVSSVQDCSADLGILINPGATAFQELEVIRCYVDRLVVVASVTHPLAQRASVRFTDILDYELVEQEVNSVLQGLLERTANDLGKAIRSRTRVGGYDAACNMALAGFGLAVVPDSYAGRYAKSVRAAVIHLEEPWATRHFWLCTRKRSEISTTTAIVLDHFRSFIAR